MDLLIIVKQLTSKIAYATMTTVILNIIIEENLHFITFVFQKPPVAVVTFLF